MAEGDEREKWEFGFGYHGFSVWVSRTIEKLGRLKKSADREQGRISLLKRGKVKSDTPDITELRAEFRAFLDGVKDQVDLYLWFSLANLADRNSERRFDSKVYKLFGDVTSTLLMIRENFDPSLVTNDLLGFLKERITRVATPGAYDLMGNASTFNQGDGEKRFMDSAANLERILIELRQDASKYFKRDKELEAAMDKAVNEAMKNR